MNNIEKKLFMLVASHGIPEVDCSLISDDTKLVEDLNIDSLQFIRLLMSIEMEFGMSFSEQFIEPDMFLTFGTLKQYVIDCVQQNVNSTQQ